MTTDVLTRAEKGDELEWDEVDLNFTTLATAIDTETAARVAAVAAESSARTVAIAAALATLATVATTGAYADLTGKPTLAAVATSGSAADLSAGTLLAARMPALTGDVTTIAGAVATTLATVNSNVGSFGSATQSVALTVNAKGLVTAASATTITPAVGSITGLGTGIATALAVNAGSAGAPVLLNGALGTPSSGTLSACTGLPISTGVSGLGTGVATALAATPNASGGVLTYGNAAVLGANTFTALQTIAQASANAGILASTGYSLTGSNATGMIDLAGTWNTSGNPIALKIAMTNTASGATSKFASFLAGAAGATEVFSVDKAGYIECIGLRTGDNSGNKSGIWQGTTGSGFDARYVGGYGGGTQRFLFGTAFFGMASDTAFQWYSGAAGTTSGDTGFSRNAAGVVEVNNGSTGTFRDMKLRNIVGQTGYHEMVEMTAPAAPSADGARIYAVDNGAGKTQLMVIFSSGAAQQLAIQP